jgi:hypothetical protein
MAINLTYSDVAFPAITGLGLGVGARLARWGYDIANKSGTRAPAKLPPVESSAVEVPVDVSEEEAEELRKKGVKVKQAADNVLDTAIQGTIGTLSTVGGWSLADKILDSKRKAKAQKSLERSRRRVQALINGESDPADQGISRALKVAADVYIENVGLSEFGDHVQFPKAAAALDDVVPSIVSRGASTIGEILKPLGIPLGIAGTLVAMKAYNANRDENKYRAKAKAMRDYLNNIGAETPTAVMVPVVRKQPAAAVG